MKTVTANRLSDGRVIYLAPDGSWTERFSGASVFEPSAAEVELARAKKRVTEIADAYLIESESGRAPAGREVLRETIRNAGPTVRRDLGKQAENQ